MEFSLSEEQKRRIEQEEGARIAEETYREQVRRSIASSAAGTRRAEPLSGTPAGITRRGVNWGTVGVAALLLFAVVIGFSVIFYRLARKRQCVGFLFDLFPLVASVTVSLAHQDNSKFPLGIIFRGRWTFQRAVRNYHVAGHYSVIGDPGTTFKQSSRPKTNSKTGSTDTRHTYSTPHRAASPPARSTWCCLRGGTSWRSTIEPRC